MQKYLFNLALIETINFCKRNNIDASGSHLEKEKRGQHYHLIKDETKKTIANVIFYPSSVPKLYV